MIMQSLKWQLTLALRTAALMAMLAVTLVVAPAAQAATITSPGAPVVTLTSGDGAAVGQALPMSVTATNATAGPITSILLTVSWAQSAAKLVGALPNPDLCIRGGSGGTLTSFTCSVGTLQPGTSVTITFAFQPNVAGTLDVNGAISGFRGGVFQRNTTTLTIPVAPAPTDVQITGFASTGSPAAGTNFHYTFQVKNGGAQPAYGVVFTDTVPAGETLIVVGTDTFAPCTIANGTATCALGDLAAGSQVLINVGVAAPTATGTLTDTGSANATNGDTQPQNNSVSIIVQVK